MNGKPRDLPFLRPRLWRIPFVVYLLLCIAWVITLCTTVSLLHTDTPLTNAYYIPLFVCVATAAVILFKVLLRTVRYLTRPLDLFYQRKYKTSISYALGTALVSLPSGRVLPHQSTPLITASQAHPYALIIKPSGSFASVSSTRLATRLAKSVLDFTHDVFGVIYWFIVLTFGDTRVYLDQYQKDLQEYGSQNYLGSLPPPENPQHQTLSLFMDSRFQANVPCDVTMTDKELLSHLSTFYYLQKMRRGLWEAVAFKTLALVEVVEVRHSNCAPMCTPFPMFTLRLTKYATDAW